METYKFYTKESYDAIAVEYTKNEQKITPEQKAKQFLKYAIPPAKLLDFGCGGGHDAEYFCQCGFEVTGIDISPNMIALAKERVPQAHFQVMDGELMDFSSDSFDAVWASASLLHVPKAKFEGVLCQICGFLKSGGVFFIAMKKGNGETLEMDQRYGGVKKFWAYYEEEELVKYLEAAGFTIVEHQVQEKSTHYQTHPWISLIAKKA